MSFASWVLLIGAVLLLMGLAAPYVQRLPFTPTMIYLVLGVMLGPLGFHVLELDPRDHVTIYLRAAEVAVVVSLFTVGAKLRLPVFDRSWIAPLVLASVSMTLTVSGIALIGIWALELSVGAAILLGGILAPTDPVLASDVQIKHPHDRDELRLALTGEAGFNDGTAFPFVLLGLGLLGLHDFGDGLWRWMAIDVLWATVAGLAIGGILGIGTGRIIIYLRDRQHESLIWDEYFLLGLIGVSYGAALALHAYGFLAVFAAGVAVRTVERRETDGVARPRRGSAREEKIALTSDKAPAVMARALLSFNEQLERILEVGMVVLVGGALFVVGVAWSALWFVPLLFLVLRPLSVLPVWLTGRFRRRQFLGIAWFGIRGIGSVYYLMYALDRGVESELAATLCSLVFTVIAASIALHGLSINPMQRLTENGRP